MRTKPSDVVTLLKRLVQIPSVNPIIEQHQNEGEISGFIADWFRRTRKFNVTEQRVTKNRFNVVVILPGRREGPSLMLNGHLDTVGTSNMTIRPFKPFIKLGLMHGRGPCDMKGPIAAMMSAMVSLAYSNMKLSGDVVFSGVVDEEYESIGMYQLVKRFRTDAAIVGEPTNMRIATAQKGYAWLEVETTGRRIHGSTPERGVDAIEKMAVIINQFESIRRKHARMRHRLVGTPKIHSSTITGGSDWATVPAKCILRVERRLLPGEKPQDSVAELRQVIAECSKRDQKLKATVRLIHYADSIDVKRARHIPILRQEAGRAGLDSKIVGVPYWTDAAILVNRARIPSCLFGPGNIECAHSPDEFINIQDVINSIPIYAETARRYCGAEGTDK
jgi:acetylornithine deacetylase/succinyl-diaminopimelate desuccinylase family protein